MFQESEGGLHYLDITQQQDQQQQGHVFSVNTVRDNKKNFTNNDCLRAVRARELQVMLGRAHWTRISSRPEDKQSPELSRYATRCPHKTSCLDLMSGP